MKHTSDNLAKTTSPTSVLCFDAIIFVLPKYWQFQQRLGHNTVPTMCIRGCETCCAHIPLTHKLHKHCVSRGNYCRQLPSSTKPVNKGTGMSAGPIINADIVRATVWGMLEFKNVKIQEDLQDNKKIKSILTCFNSASYLLFLTVLKPNVFFFGHAVLSTNMLPNDILMVAISHLSCNMQVWYPYFIFIIFLSKTTWDSGRCNSELLNKLQS